MKQTAKDMTTIRVKHQQKYTVIDNQAVRDKRLSFKARGLHHLLLSYPDDWEVNLKQLMKESDKDGRDAIAAGLKELEELGYLVKVRQRDSGRFQGFLYEIHELPHTVSGKSGNGATITGKSVSGKTVSGKTVSGKSGYILNTVNQQVLSEQNTVCTKEAHEKDFELGDEHNSEAVATLTVSDQPQKPISSNSEKDCSGSIVPARYSAVANFENALRARTRSDPWETCDESLKSLFRQYVAGCYGNAKEPESKRMNVAISVIRNARRSPEDSREYERVADLWEMFTANLQHSRTIEEANGTAKILDPELREMFGL